MSGREAGIVVYAEIGEEASATQPIKRERAEPEKRA